MAKMLVINTLQEAEKSRKFQRMVKKRKAENVKFGTSFVSNANNVEITEFVNCVFEPVTGYCTTELADITFVNCSFSGKAISLCANTTNCKFIGCKFEHAETGVANRMHENDIYEDCKFTECVLIMDWFENCKFRKCSATKGVFNCIVRRCTGRAFFDQIAPMRCPKKGEYIAWKKCRKFYPKLRKYKHVYAKLLIPADAKRSSACSEKCRASKAKVLGFYDINEKPLSIRTAVSVYQYDNSEFVYKVGKVAVPRTPFNEDRFEECAPGIHHFMTFEEAVNF